MLKFWKTRGDGKTWVEKKADECVRLRRKQVAGVDGTVFAGVEPPPVATQLERPPAAAAAAAGAAAAAAAAAVANQGTATGAGEAVKTAATETSATRAGGS